MKSNNNQLPILDCHGCGVCCFHMGYPAFNLTIDQMVKAIDGDESFRAALGEKAGTDLDRWLNMPAPLRLEILAAMRQYTAPRDGELDGVCIWLDGDTRLCKNHLHRPEVCRDFEIGCQQCLDWREHYRTELNTPS